MRLPLQTYLYSATAAAVVQSRLHCVLFRVMLYVRQKVSCSFVPLEPDPGDATVGNPACTTDFADVLYSDYDNCKFCRKFIDI